MLGFSIWKLLLILAAIIVLLFGSRILRQLGRGRSGRPDGHEHSRGDSPTGIDTGTGPADLIRCRACGAFAAGNCGRPGCPLV